MDDVELLRAALALAAIDGKLSRSEMGVIEGLANRAGIGKASLDAMLAQAGKNADIADNILIRDPAKARKAFELLVAQARIDGEVSGPERDFLVRAAASLKIVGDDFDKSYQAGIKRADAIRFKR
ncbi:MAG: hypothetical protein NTW19_23595 [Planctomycetota bacterium]|nr:hypothetical protein [Planctomycetota bacterium]